MIRIGIRELRQHASRYLAAVRAGQTVEITDRGRLVALLVPPPESDLRARLIATRELIPATHDLRDHVPVASPEADLSQALADLRAEER